MHKQAVPRGERMILAAVLALAGGCQLPQMRRLRRALEHPVGRPR
ncbi:MAG: hypothetical protein ACREXP_08860 [Steroidobacteraceae bacterium]